MQSLKTNVPSITETSVAPADQFRIVVSMGKAAGEAARALVASLIAYMLNVNHFRSAKDDDYMSLQDIREYIRKELPKQADISDQMVSVYLNVAADFYGRVTKGKMFLPVVQNVAKATNAEKACGVLIDWFDKDWKAKSLEDLRKALGYSTGRKGQAPAKPATAAKRIENVATQIEKVVELTQGPKAKATTTQVSQAIAAKVADPLDLAMQSIRNYANRPDADPDKLFGVIKLVERLVDDLTTRIEKQAKAAKAAKKAEAGKVQAKKARVPKPHVVAKTTGSNAGASVVHTPSI